MKILNKEEKEFLLKALIEDQSFSFIRQKLGVNKNYNLKTLCEYLGGKYLKAYNLHINNHKSTSLALAEDILTKSDFVKGMDFIVSQLKIENNNKLLENKTQIESKQNKNDDVYEIVQLPKVLPTRLQGENYQVKQTSVKVVDNVWQEFQQFVKSNKTYSSIEYLSLAILEFLEKYRTQ